MRKNIDPPYNTGARDWKYNNDYVDSSDSYRHSKWLSMMEKRLKLAKKLLNPEDSVLICTIDEKEYLHLGCLIEELFPEAKMQMVTSMTNKKGSTRIGSFSRRDEYIYYVFVGSSFITRSNDDMISCKSQKSAEKTIWNSLLRRGADGSSRAENPNLFYPFIVSIKTGVILDVGEPLESDISRESVSVPPGTRLGWPIRSDGSEGRWQVSSDNAREMVKKGTMKAGRYNKKSNSYAINYLKRGQLDDLEKGVLVCLGTDQQGAGIFKYTDTAQVSAEPGTMWVREYHDASIYGSTLLRKILPKRKFPFPKSLYAVRDTIRFCIANKPHALILDFFAGSGTTLHAVNLLNAEDGGQRRCILVTNNEVSDSEAIILTKQGYQPGDKEWEKLGIARYITWPRTTCSIRGKDINGNPLKGDYGTYHEEYQEVEEELINAETGKSIRGKLFRFKNKVSDDEKLSNMKMADGFQANAIYFKLGFLDKTAVALGRQFKELLSVLWMKAGSIGMCPQIKGETIPKMLILPGNRFAVLTDERDFPEFLEQIKKTPEIETVFIVTDSETGYREMANKLQVKTSYQLYRDYLDNFRINTGRK